MYLPNLFLLTSFFKYTNNLHINSIHAASLSGNIFISFAFVYSRLRTFFFSFIFSSSQPHVFEFNIDGGTGCFFCVIFFLNVPKKSLNTIYATHETHSTTLWMFINRNALAFVCIAKWIMRNSFKLLWIRKSFAWRYEYRSRFIMIKIGNDHTTWYYQGVEQQRRKQPKFSRISNE